MLRTSAPLKGALGVRYKGGVWNSFAINSQLVARWMKKTMCFAICFIGAEHGCRESGYENFISCTVRTLQHNAEAR